MPIISNCFIKINLLIFQFIIDKRDQMIVQSQLNNINKFTSSKICIFALTPLDHPNKTQQLSIISYQFVKQKLEKSKDALKQIKELCFKKSRNLQKAVIGMVYRALLYPQENEMMFNYTNQLGSNALDIYCDFFAKLVVEESDNLHQEVLQVVPIMYQNLMRYNLHIEKLTVAILRTIDYSDLSERGMTYSLSLIQVFLEVIYIIYLQDKKQQGGGIGKLIFIKTLRVLTSVFVFEEEQDIKIYIQKCKNLLLMLWKVNKKECLQCGIEAFRFLQDLLTHPEISQLFEQYRSAYYANQKQLLRIPKQKYDQLLAINIPASTFDAIGFCLNTSAGRIYTQLEWFEKQNQENRNIEMIMIDILRYMIRIVQHPNNFIFIQWIMAYSDRNTSVMFKHLLLQALFLDWFVNESLTDNEMFARTFMGLCVLKGYQTHPTKFQQMLEFILFQQYKLMNEGQTQVKDNLLKIFKIAEQKNMFSIHDAMHGKAIDGILKGQLELFLYGKKQDNAKIELNSNSEYKLLSLSKGESSIMQYQSDHEDNQPKHSQVEDPQTDLNKFFTLKNATASNSPLNEKLTPLESLTIVQNVPSSQKPKQPKSNNTLTLNLQKLFVESCQPKLISLFANPTKQNYQPYFDHLISVCKKIYSDKDVYQRFIQEATRIIYILFQSHWQKFYSIQSIPPEDNIISFHINGLLKLWGTNEMALQLHRKILRAATGMFPIAIFAICFVFLMLVPTAKGNSQGVCAFLINDDSKKKIENVMNKLIPNEELLKNVKNKAIKYKILIK